MNPRISQLLNMLDIYGMGTYEWDIPNNLITYSQDYLRLAGVDELEGTLEEWESLHHPDDLAFALQLLDGYINGEAPSYACELRMRHRDGHYIHTKDIGLRVERDDYGQPLRFFGLRLDVHNLKSAKEELGCTLSEWREPEEIHEIEEIEEQREEVRELEIPQPEEIQEVQAIKEPEPEEQPTEAVETPPDTGEQQVNKLLWMVNHIAKELLGYDSSQDVDLLINNCLKELIETFGKNRVYIWQNHLNEKGELCCTQVYEWVNGVQTQQGNPDLMSVPYHKSLPTFLAMLTQGRCLNSLVRYLSTTERKLLSMQGIQSILIAPINIKGKIWGFIGVDNCEAEELFTQEEERLLTMSGVLLATVIQKAESEAFVREMEERNHLMLNAMPLCCNLWTRELQNMACNDEAVRLFELESQQEYLDQFFELSPEYQPCGRLSAEMAVEYINKAFDEGYCRFEWMHQKLNGEPMPSEITLVRIKYKDDYIVCGYTRDLRELKAMLAEMQRVQDDLRSAHEEALLSSKAKTNFLTNMSHEIRTPMNAISGMAEIILRESKGRATAEYAMGIKNACNNLLNIVNDILDISKIESGKLEIVKAEYYLASLLNDSINIARVRLGDKPILFITNVDSRLPAVLYGDESRIKQILLNLLGNAIKFTQSGMICLNVTGKCTDNKVMFKFEVSDTGSGIKEEDLNRLFVEFERVNTTKNRSIEGTGLGLAICKRLCEMMDGSIEVSSTYGQGATFTVTLCQEFEEYFPLASVETKKSVLLLEPRELYAMSIKDTVENLGCTCDVCASQSHFNEMVVAKEYDFIFTPSLHLKKVKSIVSANSADVNIAVLLNFGETYMEQDTYTIFLPATCLQVAEVLDESSDPQQRQQNNAIEYFTAPEARVLVVDDNAVNLLVAKGLMEPYLLNVDTAQSGMDAIEMVKSGKYDLVFMDHMMPEMDGIDATVAIRALEGDYFKNLPIVALTANAILGTREMFLQEGMDDFLAKPVELHKLNHILAKWLPKEKQSKATAGDVLSVEKPELVIEGVNTLQGIISVGGDKENYMYILSVYYADGLSKYNSLLRLIRDDLDRFKIEIHALKSASATIGASNIASSAQKLEMAAKSEDIEYIEEHIPAFLSAFKELLDNIKPFAADVPEEEEGEGKLVGELSYLQEEICALCTAVEFMNITRIEDILNRIAAFEWPPEVTEELLCIREHMANFNYDDALACANRLKV